MMAQEMATHATNHLSKVVGANIATARERKGITQLQLAAELSTSTSRVSGWERGLHMPSRRQQPALAEVLFDGDIGALYRETEKAA